MQPERLVASADVILLVEGQHDIEVLQAFLAPELARHLVLFVALGGTEGLSSIAESALLFGMTKAPIVICLDSLARSVGDDLRRLKGASGSSERYRLLAQFRAQPEYKRQREMRALLALFKEAVAQERLDRLEVHGFAKPDIVRYLDVDLMTSKSGSWEDLEQKFLREMNQERFREGDGGKFKTWIGPAYQVRGVRTAAMEQVRRWNEDLGVTAHRPSEFADLAALLDRLHPNRASGEHSDLLAE